MTLFKIKSTKYADVLVVGDETGPQMVTIATRLKATDHGGLFKELLLKMAPTALAALDREIRDKAHPTPGAASRNVASGVVQFCEDLTMAAIHRMTENSALGVSLPSYAKMAARFKPADPSQGSVSPNVVAMNPRHEEKPT